MSLVLSLDKKISASVIEQWLTLSDMSLLDCALCNHILRNKYLSLLKKYSDLFQNVLCSSYVFPLTSDVLNWFSNRSLHWSFPKLLINDHSVTKLKSESAETKANLISKLDNVKEITIDANFFDAIELIVHCNAVTKVTIVEASTAIVESVGSHCPKIASCDVSGADDLLSEHAIISVCLHCPDLQELNVSGCKEVSGQLLRVIAVHCPHLTSLNVQDCDKITKRDILMFGLHFKGKLTKFIYNQLCNLQLRTLIWSTNFCIDSLDLSFNSDALTDAAVKEIGVACAHLTSVNMYQCAKVTDVGVIALVEAAPSLTAINLEGLEHITDSSLLALTSQCTALQEIYLNFNTGLTVIGLSSIAKLGKSLLKLSLLDVSLTDDTLIAIGTECTALTSLDVSYNKELSDYGFTNFAPHCKHLKKIHMAYCSLVTDATFISFSYYCESLESVDVSRCTLLSDAFLNVLIDKHTQLKQLRMCCNHHITSTALESIGANLHHLTHLAIVDLHLTNAILVSILTHCKAIIELDISINNKVTDETFKQIAPFCDNIKRLSIRECDYVTNASLFRLSDHCESLVFLDVSGCSNVTLGGLHMIRDACNGSLKIEHECCELVTVEEERLQEAEDAAAAAAAGVPQTKKKGGSFDEF